MEKELNGKVAIVTGAGRLRGIGRASAVALAEMGADVVITGTGRDPDNYPEDEKSIGWKDIESTAEQIRNKGSKAKTIIMDISKEEDVDRMIQETIDEFGRIDILVNNAAPPYGEDRVPVIEVDNELFKKLLFVKVYGSYLCSKAAAKIMIDQGEGGRIINLSSSAGKEGSPRMAAYNAANFGVVGMTQSLARELGPHNINVNAVCPGAVDTSRMDVVRDDWDKMAAATPIGRNGTDEEVGDFCAYLCTEAASWIHGQSINQNGGSVMEH
jgi:3-oxoacyl-[acyl-carrier protein] reductase/meso-butanediol dehydrogenase/(S,S)-butanediol dehydrogenase/diacetyl reductase